MSCFFSIIYFEKGQSLTDCLIIWLFLIFLMIMLLFERAVPQKYCQVFLSISYQEERGVLGSSSTGFNFDYLGKVVSARFGKIIQD